MAFDLSAHLATMTRVVTSGERDGTPTKSVVASRVYGTDPDDLWEAITDPERLQRWFLPVSGDLRVGGRYQFHGNAGGTITTCDPPRTLDATWEYGGGVSWVTVRLTPEPGGTRLELEHVAHVDDEFWPRYGPGAAGIGWDMGFMGLARHLHAPDAAPRPPEEDATWMASAEAMDLYRTTSDAWARAAIDDGTPRADATAAAERARAFYAGEATDDPSAAG